jgi:hypothetical protein
MVPDGLWPAEMLKMLSDVAHRRMQILFMRKLLSLCLQHSWSLSLHNLGAVASFQMTPFDARVVSKMEYDLSVKCI